MTSNNKDKTILKIVYFDDASANDYISIQNGGSIDWTTNENKNKIAEIVAQIDSEAKGGFNFLSFVKATIAGQFNTKLDYETSKLINKTVSNTVLTDYLELSKSDKNINKFSDGFVYAPKDSITVYRMYSSYLNIVPKEDMPINVEGLNNAILGERGYYQMIFEKNSEEKKVLRFNINAFKNNYSLADLPKMNLTFYAIKVGETTLDRLSLENEFLPQNSEKIKPSAEDIVDGTVPEKIGEIPIFDVVLAGVMSEH